MQRAATTASRGCSSQRSVGARSIHGAAVVLGGQPGDVCSAWSRCSLPCGGGVTFRTCPCFGSGRECAGAGREEQECHVHRCAAAWSCWTEWGSCSLQCGRGQRRRHRRCSDTLGRPAAALTVDVACVAGSSGASGRRVGLRWRWRACPATNCTGLAAPAPARRLGGRLAPSAGGGADLSPGGSGSGSRPDQCLQHALHRRHPSSSRHRQPRFSQPHLQPYARCWRLSSKPSG